ncbi:MAG: DNA repair protein RecO [Mariprofundaceae bacterium]|nr:DNA repair protein RecO [Mariprofundaceae bacterium]
MAEQHDEALLLRRIPYSESSLICHFFTKKHGKISLMARGARRLKSPFRSALSPLYDLHIHWQEGRTGMGQLRSIQRDQCLLNEADALLGLELLANIQHLFQESDEHAFQMVHEALFCISERGGKEGLCMGVWLCLKYTGCLGELFHCWHCGQETMGNMLWKADQLACLKCATTGLPVSIGLRKSMHAIFQHTHVHLNQADLKTWQAIIGLLLQEHRIKVSESFL